MNRKFACLLAMVMFLTSLGQTVNAQPAMARLRIVHAASTAGLVDVFVDGQRLLAQMPYATVSDYLDVPAGARRVSVVAAGADPASATIVAEPVVEPGKAYSIAAIGLADAQTAVYTDDLTPPAAGKTRVRVIHTSPDAPGAEVRVVNGPTLIQNLGFRDASAYLSVDAGSYDLQVAAIGETSAFLQLPDTTLVAGTIVDVVAVGRLADIQVAIGSYTPAAAPQQETAQQMPASGASTDSTFMLLVAGLCALVCGGIVRRSIKHGTTSVS